MVTDSAVLEDAKLGALLDKHLLDRDVERLQFYQAAGLSGIRLFLKAEGKKGEKYYELDPLESLKEGLKKKTIIEYPTINVVLKDHVDCFDVIDSGRLIALTILFRFIIMCFR